MTAVALTLLITLSANGHAQSSPQQLVAAAQERTTHQVTYDGSYQAISYPGGDVADNIGVCTDVIIRSYRALGIDLQQQVHEDIASHFDAYPSRRLWGHTRPDTNIDHRRVPNLQVFFQRRGSQLPVTDKADDYRPGDLVTWTLPGNLPHIGIVSDRRGPSGAFKVVHNIGYGPRLDDRLFSYPITGHYRYFPGEISHSDVPPAI